MSLKRRFISEIPEETAHVAKQIHGKGNIYMQIRDELTEMFNDEMFSDLYSSQGRSAVSPSKLVLVLIMQYMADYSDRQAIEAVRDKISWKYVLGMKLTDKGFDHSVLSDFRKRLIEHNALEQIFNRVLNCLSDKGLLTGKTKQRTDATHVLASIRNLNRIELVGDTMRVTLNRIAQVDPSWLESIMPMAWIDRYGQRFNDWHLPRKAADRQALVAQIGIDGYELLANIYHQPGALPAQELPEVEVMRRIWVQQFWCDETETIHLPEVKDTPRGKELIESPFDSEARFSMKSHGKTWIGYKTHFTETCDDNAPRIITHVQTCSSTEHDSQATAVIQTALCDKGMKPQEHYLDGGYASVRDLIRSQQQQIICLSPLHVDSSWQAKQEHAFDLSYFTIDWQHQQVTCPQAVTSTTWSPSHNQAGDPVIHSRFAQKQCQACPVREQCTRAKARSLKLRPEQWHRALIDARQYQLADEFRDKYRIRAGIEGTFSAANRVSDLRHTPFIGLQKTHLHCLFSAIALNLKRAINWLNDVPIATTRKSCLTQFATTT